MAALRTCADSCGSSPSTQHRLAHRITRCVESFRRHLLVGVLSSVRSFWNRSVLVPTLPGSMALGPMASSWLGMTVLIGARDPLRDIWMDAQQLIGGSVPAPKTRTPWRYVLKHGGP
jgi:hypothetical protein